MSVSAACQMKRKNRSNLSKCYVAGLYKWYKTEMRLSCKENLLKLLPSEGLQCFDAVGWAAGRASGL